MKPDLSKRNHDNIKRLSLSFTISTNKLSTLCLQKLNTFINVAHFIVEKRGPTVDAFLLFLLFSSCDATQPTNQPNVQAICNSFSHFSDLTVL